MDPLQSRIDAFLANRLDACACMSVLDFPVKSHRLTPRETSRAFCAARASLLRTTRKSMCGSCCSGSGINIRLTSSRRIALLVLASMLLVGSMIISFGFSCAVKSVECRHVQARSLP